MEYYTADKNNNILKFAAKWMELENIILSQGTQTRKDKYHMWVKNHSQVVFKHKAQT